MIVLESSLTTQTPNKPFPVYTETLPLGRQGKQEMLSSKFSTSVLNRSAGPILVEQNKAVHF